MNAEDSLVFTSREVEVMSTTPEVIKKDSIVIYKNTRYRGYVYINPSKMKVFKTSYSENGISVDNVYYDNVIHICVYEGKKMLYGCNSKKEERVKTTLLFFRRGLRRFQEFNLHSPRYST